MNKIATALLAGIILLPLPACSNSEPQVVEVNSGELDLLRQMVSDETKAAEAAEQNDDR